LSCVSRASDECVVTCRVFRSCHPGNTTCDGAVGTCSGIHAWRLQNVRVWAPSAVPSNVVFFVVVVISNRHTQRVVFVVVVVISNSTHNV
jgi:hypothetical protein